MWVGQKGGVAGVQKLRQGDGGVGDFVECVFIIFSCLSAFGH